MPFNFLTQQPHMAPMELQGFFLIAATILGFISLSKLLANILKWVWVMFLRPSKNLKHYGSWALVTGSTDGIGKAIAFRLASKGLNLVLIGRNSSKLEATSNEVREKYGGKVEIKNIVMDFDKTRGEDIARRIEKEIEGLDVGILINNVGMAYPYAKFFNEVDVELMESLIKVNIDATTWVTKAVLPGMLKKKKGAIVNIGSAVTVALSSYPLHAAYAAAKAYIEMFSKCISLEYKHQGIDIQCQTPLAAATKMSSIRKPSLFAPSPETYSRASIRFIGYERLCMPYWPHSVMWFIFGIVPDAILDSFLLRRALSVRKRGMQKESMRAKVK